MVSDFKIANKISLFLFNKYDEIIPFCCPSLPCTCMYVLSSVWNATPKGYYFCEVGFEIFPFLQQISFFTTDFLFIHFILFLKCIGTYDVYPNKTHYSKKLFVVDTAHMKDVHYLLRSFFSRLQ